ncbi:hypothetical protein ILUMI_20488 [Ignelater luminosus]|uniref:snRNA-activating protein complex subunit 3 n=1 Tax=Ignelater luminosus TaxID=2038154 RepID=A0A8K0CKU6_IGNLU|nr:hypothetical protein ILUMI_20488 [Ignelater luminosus]
MHKVYPPNKYRCSKRIPLKRYFEEYGEIYKKIPKNSKSKKTEDKKLETILDDRKIFDKEKRQELIKLCSIYNKEHESKDGPSTSKSQAKKRMREPIVVSEEAKRLHTVRTRMKYHGKFQQKHQDDEGYVCELKPHKSKKTNIQPATEFAVSIRVYYPFYCDGLSGSFTKLRFSHEIVVLGSNTLTDLRDKISCRADFGVCIEVEHPNDELPSMPTAKEKYPSGFIFINNVFYNDMRHENAIDYSEVIRNWAKKNKHRTSIDSENGRDQNH